MNRFLENLKLQAEENPALALGIGAGLLTAASKFLDVAVKAKNSRNWDREITRREMKLKKQ